MEIDTFSILLKAHGHSQFFPVYLTAQEWCYANYGGTKSHIAAAPTKSSVLSKKSADVHVGRVNLRFSVIATTCVHFKVYIYYIYSVIMTFKHSGRRRERLIDLDFTY